jgi:hypothetical protein
MTSRCSSARATSLLSASRSQLSTFSSRICSGSSGLCGRINYLRNLVVSSRRPLELSCRLFIEGDDRDYNYCSLETAGRLCRACMHACMHRSQILEVAYMPACKGNDNRVCVRSVAPPVAVCPVPTPRQAAAAVRSDNQQDAVTSRYPERTGAQVQLEGCEPYAHVLHSN